MVISINFFKQKVFELYELDNQLVIVIPQGSNLDEITSILLQKSIIKDSLFFKSWVRLHNFEKKLKAGEYLIKKKISLNSIMQQLHEGKSIIHLFRIGEGTTKYQVNEKINETINKFKDININSLPENLIADTYDYTTNDSLESFIQNITQVSQKRALQIWKNRDKSIPLQSIDDLFIIASIIEKETGKENEKEIIASVFYNRLHKNMKLQSDPTVIFSLKKGKGLKRKLTRKDLKNKSPYNTYFTKGLPPSPICYPSLSSLKAAAKPLDTDFLYFVADGKGGHIFSKNYKDHLYNVKRFRNARKENQR